MAFASPILASGRTAARLLDLKPADFLRLVDEGHLPRPREIAPGVVRWDVEELRRIITGSAADGMEDVAW